jgi:predicted SnoaL-like aldol condensation-catalyzing enzyme
MGERRPAACMTTPIHFKNEPLRSSSWPRQRRPLNICAVRRADGKHHSPHFAAGFDALKSGMEENSRHFPHKQLTLKHALSEGDLVAIHSHVVLEPGDLGIAVMHLFRFEEGKLVELWDFAQPVPAESPNADGLF